MKLTTLWGSSGQGGGGSEAFCGRQRAFPWAGGRQHGQVGGRVKIWQLCQSHAPFLGKTSSSKLLCSAWISATSSGDTDPDNPATIGGAMALPRVRGIFPLPCVEPQSAPNLLWIQPRYPASLFQSKLGLGCSSHLYIALYYLVILTATWAKCSVWV